MRFHKEFLRLQKSDIVYVKSNIYPFENELYFTKFYKYTGTRFQINYH